MELTIVFMDNDHPTNADLKRSFDEHAKHDEAFQKESREVDKGIQDSLALILNKLDPDHKEYILKNAESRIGNIENKLDPEHHDYILHDTNEQMKVFNDIKNGIVFARNALIWISGGIAACAIIAGSVIGTIRFIK